MTLPTLTTGSMGRQYLWNPLPGGADGTHELVVPSVTEILKQLDKSFLIGWTGKMAGEYAFDNQKAWTHLDRDSAVTLIKGAAWRSTKPKIKLGNLAHAALETSVQGDEPIEIQADVLPYLNAGIAFLKAINFEPLYVEKTVYSREYQYAGTCDLFGTFDWLGERHTGPLDWKTGNLYDSAALQLVAYANGDFIGTANGDDGWIEHPMPDCDMGLVIQLDNEGGWKAHSVNVNEPRLMKTFVALRTLYHYQTFVKKTAFGKNQKGTATMATQGETT